MAFAPIDEHVLASAMSHDLRPLIARLGRPDDHERPGARLIGRLMIAVAIVVLTLGCRAPSEPHRPVYAGDASRAPELFRQFGCVTCHTIPGVAGAYGGVGPPLWAMADRAYIAGVLPNTEVSMIRWIVSPRDVNPLTAMPATGVSEQDARDMAAYLATLRAEPVALRMLRGYVERAIGRQVREPWIPPDLSGIGE